MERSEFLGWLSESSLGEDTTKLEILARESSAIPLLEEFGFEIVGKICPLAVASNSFATLNREVKIFFDNLQILICVFLQSQLY